MEDNKMGWAKGMFSVLLFSILCLRLPPAWADFTGIPPASSDYQATIGTGYSTQTQSFKGECIEGDLATIGIDMANLSFRQSISRDRLAQELGFGLGGRARFGLLQANAAAKFYNEAKTDSYSISAIYSGDYQIKNVILTKPRVTPIAEKVLGNDDRWLDACGDEYVEQIKLGGKIFFTIRIDFASQSDKRAFEVNFNIGGPIWGASTAVKNAANRFSKRTQVTVSAFQMGGSVDQLSKIFGNSELFIKCSLGEFSNCESVLNSAVKYAAEAFPEQLKKSWNENATKDHPYGLGTPNGPAVMKYLTKPYSTAGVFFNRPFVVNLELKKARKALDDYFVVVIEQMAQVERLLAKNSRRLSERQSERLLEVRSKLERSSERMLAIAQNCYDHPDVDCIVEVNALNPEISGGMDRVTPKDLLVENESFAQFCDEGLSPQSSIELTQTIKALVNHAKTLKPELFRPNVHGQEIDECYLAGLELQRHKDLDFSSQEKSSAINDLRPLQEFVQLERLTINHNPGLGASPGGIVDLSPIGVGSAFGGLKNLKYLSLSGNQIEDVTPLKGLERLEVLNLSNNKISDASPLASLKNLKRLDLRNNQKELPCPLPDQSICFNKDFANVGQFIRTQRRTQVPRFGLTATAVQIPQAGSRVLMIGGTIAGSQQFAESFSAKDGLYEIIGGPDEVRQFHTATQLNSGEILILGGQGRSTGYLFQAPSNRWESLKNKMSVKRAAHTATLLPDGRVLITGGYSAPTLERPTRSVEIFDPNTHEFKLLSSGLSVARAFHTATLLSNGTVLIAGGYGDKHSISTADLFDPVSETVSPILQSRMSRGRGGHQASLLKDGRVLITGGMDEDQALDTAEIYDQNKNSFQNLSSSMKQRRACHQSNLLDNGLVLLTGGQQQIEGDFTGETCKSCLGSAEIFDPVTNDFSPLNSSMSYPRAHHAAVPLGSGSIFIVGGLGIEAGSSAEIFSYTVN